MTGLGCSDTSADPPDIIFVALDNVRWDHTSLSDYHRDTTPTLTTLASMTGATTFARTYATASWSLPSYLSIFTGLDAVEHGVGFRSDELSVHHPTLAQVLSVYEYRTGGFSSGPHLSTLAGVARGFEHYVHEREFRGLDARVDAALDWMDDAPDEPAFVFLHGYDAHAPYVVPELFSELFDDGPEHPETRGEACGGHGFGSQPPSRACLGTVGLSEDGRSTMVLMDDAARIHRMGSEPVELMGQPDVRELLPQWWKIWKAGGAISLEPEDLRGQRAMKTLGTLGLASLLRNDSEGWWLDAELLSHVDLTAEHPLLRREIAHYDAAIFSADVQLGRFLSGLEERGRLRDSIIVVFSDHGHSAVEPGQVHVERGDPAYRVPLVIVQPSSHDPVRWDGVVSMAGLAPSLLDALEFRVPIGAASSGLFDVLESGGGVQPNSWVLSTGICHAELRHGDDGLAWSSAKHWDPSSGLAECGEGLFSVLDGAPDPKAPEWEPFRERLLAVSDLLQVKGNAMHGPAGEEEREILREAGYWTPGEAP